MKKNIIVAALVTLGGLNAMAQVALPETTRSTTYETETQVDTIEIHYTETYHQDFKDNWSLELLAGARVLFAEEDGNLSFGKRLSPAFSIGMTKECTPDISFRGLLSVGTFKGWNTGAPGLYKGVADWSDTDPVREYLESHGTDCSNGYEQNLRYLTFDADVMLNLFNLFRANNQIGRKWNPYFVVGLEYFQMIPYHGYKATYKVGGHLGFKCDVNVAKRMALTAEIGGALHSATMDNEIGKGHRIDTYNYAALGVKFRLGHQGYRVDKILLDGDYLRMGNIVTDIKEQYEIPATSSQALIIGNLFAPSVVFDDNAESYSEELQMVNMFRISEYMKDNPKLKVSVIGNTHSVSQDLAERRANIVRQVLINRYGIDANRLIATTLDVNREYNVKGNDQSVNFGMAQ